MKKEENSYYSENGIKQYCPENRTMQKCEQGITLVALVITIIVLLILAGISLNLIGGSNGILNRAQKAASEMKLAQLKESLELSNTEKVMDEYAEGEYLQDLYDYIKEKCEENPDKTVETSNGAYWLDDDNMHYKCKEPDTRAELIKDKNGNPAIKDTEDNNPSGDVEETLPTLIKGENVDFEYTPKGWTNGNVTVQVVTKNLDITGCIIQTSKDDVNWENADTQTFGENGTLHVRLVKGTQEGDEITEEINNIDTTKPVIIKVDEISNGLTIMAKDEESGIVGYLVTNHEQEPTIEEFIACGNTKAFEKTVTEIPSGTQYVWVIDEAGNISQGKTVQIKDDKEPLPTLIKGENIDFEYTPKGWTNGNVTVQVVTKNLDITGCIIQTSKEDVNWEDTDTQTFDENGTLHVRLARDTEYSEEVTEEIKNIDTTVPEVIEVVAQTNQFVFKAKDEGSGIAGYAITETNEKPTSFTKVNDSPKEFQQLVENKKNDITYYVWVQDAVGNVNQTGALVNLKAVESANNTNITAGETTWNGTNATVTFNTTSTLTLQWCTTQSTNDADWTTGTSATVPSGTTIYIRLWDGNNGGNSYAAHKPVLKYEVRYYANGGTGTMTNSKHNYGEEQALTTNTFSKIGYTFAGWATSTDGAKVYDNNQNVTDLSHTDGDVVNLYAVWTANTNTVYKVVHQQMNVNGSGYTVVATDSKTGTTDANVTPSVNTYTGFTSPATQTVKIAANGSTTVTYSYTRNKYRFTLGSSTGVTTTGSTATGDYYYGATITLKATCTGCVWKQWTSSNSSLVGNKTTANTTFTMPAGAVTMTPEKTELPAMAKSVSATNYGDVVEYSANGVTDWKIFYKDANAVYIITSDYVPTSKLPLSAIGNGGAASTSTHDVRWPSGSSLGSFDEGWTKSNQGFLKTDLSSRKTIGCYILCSYFLDSDIWNAFAQGSSGGKAITGNQCIAGPTLQMFAASWNEKGNIPTIETYVNSSNLLKMRRQGASSSATSVKLGSGDTLNDTLYLPHQEQYGGCQGYRLSEPGSSSTSTTNICGVSCVGELGGAYSARETSSSYHYGFRPLVRLDSSVKGYKRK